MGRKVVGGNYNRRQIDAGKTNDLSLHADAAAAAKHEEFERLVHAATFLSRGEYKSTRRRLPHYASKSCPPFNRPRHIRISAFSSPCLSVCLSVWLTVGITRRIRTRAKPISLTRRHLRISTCIQLSTSNYLVSSKFQYSIYIGTFLVSGDSPMSLGLLGLLVLDY